MQDNIGSWLCEEMREEGVEIDQLDMAANTPLHLAARGGRTAMAATLLHLGASVHMKVLFFIKSFYPANEEQVRIQCKILERNT